jgi:F-type H+-transporting ATPase subunit alpha
VLKQDQFAPVPVEEQVVLIFAGTRGFLDRIETADVRRYESEVVAWMKSKKPELMASIREKKELKDSGLEPQLTAALQEFAGVFTA